MISTSFYVGWLYVFSVKNFLDSLISKYDYKITYEQKIGVFENQFFIYGNPKEVYSVSAHIENWFKSFD
jgi:hypothetical protein